MISARIKLPNVADLLPLMPARSSAVPVPYFFDFVRTSRGYYVWSSEQARSGFRFTNGSRSCAKEAAMSGTSDKASGLINEVIGKVKQGVGSALGSENLKAKGRIQEGKGQNQPA